MRRNRIIYIFLLIAAAIFAGAYQSKLTFVILITLAALPVATLLLLILERFALKLEVNPKGLFVQKLRSFSITVTIRNRFIVPMSPVRVTGVFQDEDGNIINDKTMIVSVMPLCKTELLFGGCLKYRGEYHLGVCEAALYDLLGIFCIRAKISPSCDVVVAPRRLTLERTDSLCTDDYDSAQTKMSFFESNSFSSIREYAEGETLRYVHWKLSAKQDTLMVKQMEQNLGASSVIITDMTAFSDSDEENIRAADAAVEVSLAITGKIVSEGRSAVNMFRSGGEEAEIFPVESPEDYDRLYCIFSVIPITENGGIAKLVNKMQESAVSSETLFIAAPRVDSDDMRRLLGGELSGFKKIHVFLTAGEPDAGLISLAETDTRLVLSEIDPEDIALSLRNILSDK